MDYTKVLTRAGEAWSRSQYELDTELFLKGTIDEVSVLWSDEGELDDFVQWCVFHSKMEHFNSVQRDRMVRLGEETAPSMVLDPNEQFFVRFEFLRFPGADWRIEAMCVLEGIAPLHSAALSEKGPGCIVHASFKAKDRETYRHYKSELEHDEGPFKAVTKAAEYMNSYGLFAYYGTGDRPYLKPRVNLRDAATA